MFLGILISLFLALIVALFQYRPWNKSSLIFWLLTFFRTISIAILILLLFRLSVQQKKIQKIKPSLVLMIDNSQSIEHLDKTNQVNLIYNSIINNRELQNKFKINSFSFGKDIKPLDCLDFKSKQSNITQDGAFGINQRSTLDGSLNGSRNPWTVRINTKINKRFSLDVGQLDNKKKLGFNVYLQVQNLLNTMNVRSVYRATGNPDDDGYLSDASAQTDINAQNDPQSFRDMYMMKINNPSNYSLPRMARLGIEINF